MWTKLHADGTANLLNTTTQRLNYNGHELSLSDHCGNTRYSRVFHGWLWSNYDIWYNEASHKWAWQNDCITQTSNISPERWRTRHAAVFHFVTISAGYFAPGRGAKHCDEYVCLSVCLSTRMTRKPYGGRTSPKFLCMLPVALSQSSSDGVAILMFMYFRFWGWRNVVT